jgi:hypothetical protein
MGYASNPSHVRVIMLNDFYNKWNRFSLIGWLLSGLGLSIIGDAIICKAKGRGWFVKGTLGLLAFNAGLAFFGEAVKSRTLYEIELNKLHKHG